MISTQFEPVDKKVSDGIKAELVADFIKIQNLLNI